jgi:hypothetical protein
MNKLTGASGKICHSQAKELQDFSGVTMQHE